MPGDDEIDDTIEDLPNWDRDRLAEQNFGAEYRQLPDTLRNKVDDVAENIMSYHFQEPIGADLTRMTEGQLDRFSKVTDEYYSRRMIRTGSTLYAHTTNCTHSRDDENSNSLNESVNTADLAGGDIILLCPGKYGGAITIEKPVTIRATRRGPAAIGICESR